jgi:sulfide:quinone oxidoreductase
MPCEEFVMGSDGAAHTSSKSPDAAAAAAQATPLGPCELSQGIAVGRTPTRDEVGALAAAGFRSLINNRPDGEKDSPMTSAQIEALASALGLAYVHIPVEGRNPLEKDIRAFEEALQALPRPVYAFCHSGGRSAALWALASVAGTATEALIEVCAKAGYDVSGLAVKMDMRREMLEDTEA